MSDSVRESQDFTPDDDELIVEREELDEDERPAVEQREGLPAGFRMRHDKHYVDQLLDRSSPPRLHSSVPALDAQFATELAEGIEAASACLTLNNGEARRTFTGRVAKDLLAIELHRAGRLARAAAVAAIPPTVEPRPVSLAVFLEDIVASTEAARRMVGMAMDVMLPDGDLRVTADTRLLTLALAGTIDAIISRVDGPGALRVAARAGSGGATVAIEVTLPASLGVPLSTRPLERRGDQHPWGLSGAIHIVAVERIVEAHGGRVELRTGSPGESVLALVLPR